MRAAIAERDPPTHETLCPYVVRPLWVSAVVHLALLIAGFAAMMLAARGPFWNARGRFPG
jgi:hypothetical protein